MAWLLVVGILGAGRAGYSPDEELTALTAASASVAGVPHLPSGVVYLRGLIFVKLAAVAGTLSPDLATYRLVSLAFGLVSVLLAALLARRAFDAWTAGIVALLLAASPLLGAMSVFARPYSAAVAVLLTGLLVVDRAVRDARAAWLFVAGVAIAQGVHEAGALLALLPVALVLTMETAGPERRRGMWLAAVSAGVAVAVQLALGAAFDASVRRELGEPEGLLAVVVLRSLPWPPLDLPALAHPITIAVVSAFALSLASWLRSRTRAPWPFLLIGAVLATSFLLGPLLAATVLAALARPDGARGSALAGLSLAAFSAAVWVAHTVAVTDAALSWPVASGLVTASAGYAWSWVAHLGWHLPLTSAFALFACIRALQMPAQSGRLIAATTWLLLFLFGIAAVPVLDRYFLLVMPFALALAASTVAGAAGLVGHRLTAVTTPAARTAVVALTAASLAGVLIYEPRADAARRAQSGSARASRAAAAVWVPDTQFGDEGARPCVTAIPPGDLLVCNDELACRHLAGRADAWLLPDPELRRVLSVERGNVRRGIYTGSTVLPDEDGLARWLDARADRDVTIALFATPKFGFEEQRAIVERVALDRAPFVARACGDEVATWRFGRR